MGLLQDMIRRLREKREERQSYERQQRIMRGYDWKRLSIDERELIRHKKEKREEAIRKTMANIRKRQSAELWQGRKNNPAFAPNVIANHPNIFKNGKSSFLKKANLKHPKMFVK